MDFFLNRSAQYGFEPMITVLEGNGRVQRADHANDLAHDDSVPAEARAELFVGLKIHSGIGATGVVVFAGVTDFDSFFEGNFNPFRNVGLEHIVFDYIGVSTKFGP